LKEPFIKYINKELDNGFLLIACGLPGTWKTETTEEVAKIKGYSLLRSDLIRLKVLKNDDIFDKKIAANMDKRILVYNEMFREADEILLKEKGVILDATFITQSLRSKAAAIAAKYKIPFVILQTDCPQKVSIERIMRRSKENYESNALTKQAYLNNKKSFEEINLDELKAIHHSLSITHLVVDTSHDKPKDWSVIDVIKK
jgi:hypothetical protein